MSITPIGLFKVELVLPRGSRSPKFSYTKGKLGKGNFTNVQWRSPTLPTYLV